MPYPAIKENSPRHFLNCLLSEGRSCLPCRVHGCGLGEGQSSTLDARRFVGRRPWLVHSGTDNFSGSTLQLFHMRTVKAMIIGNSGVGKTNPRGQVHTIDWLFIRGSLCESQYRTVRLRPLLDSILLNHWNRFYHQDIPSSLQARRVGDSKPGPRTRQVSCGHHSCRRDPFRCCPSHHSRCGQRCRC